MLKVLVILLLPLAAYSGWRLAMNKEARDLRRNKARASYFEGINFLLNDQNDRAIETFTQLPELNQKDIDSQLILGTLFRKRGELDHALHLHQQLEDKALLTAEQRYAVRYELAEDYHWAGMYVQAQELYEQLLPTDFRPQAVREALGRIYERMGLWEKAIEIGGAKPHQVAQYYCQLASQNTDPIQTQVLLQKALRTDYSCVRAHYLKAQWAKQQGEWINVISGIQTIHEFRPGFLPELLPLLREAYDALNQLDKFEEWLIHQAKQRPTARLMLALQSYLPAEMGKALLNQQFQETGSPFLWVNILPMDDYPKALAEKLRPQTIYQCDECGFRHAQWIWHCPACFNWSSFKPVLEWRISER